MQSFKYVDPHFLLYIDHRLYIAIDLLHIMYQNSENKKNTQEIFLQWAQITKYCVTT